MGDTVKVWDEWGQENTNAVDAWNSWKKVQAEKGFPGGLIAFLQTSTDSEGCGFAEPTIVQAYAWPILQSGKDLVGVAKTGSGKTLAFLLPGFIKLRRLKKRQEVDTDKGPALLVMTPTRELCHQIYEDAAKFGKPVQLTAACAYGGQPKREQEWQLRQSPDCLIATPGRLNDFADSEKVDLSQVRFAVLDEADRMLDMGFEPQISKILERVPTDRQTSMFTATWPKECRDLAKRYIKYPVQIQIGNDEITANRDIEQKIEVCGSDKEKMVALKRIMGSLSRSGNCLVFCNTKKKCRDLSWELSQDRDLPSVELHGDLDQSQRDASLAKFKSGDARVLVATDVAARGLDIRNITVVVNYDAPNNPEDYVHRIGRTGRAGDKGEAYTFLSSWGDDKKARNIMGCMQKAGQQAPQVLQDLADGKAPASSSGDSWGKDEWWKKDDKKDDEWWKKDDKKDEWGKKDDKKDEWWKKDEKKDEWWKKDDKKDEWWKKDDKKDEWWKKDDKKDEKKDEWWKKDDNKKADWWKHDDRTNDDKDEWWKKDDKSKKDEKKDEWWKKDEGKKEEGAAEEAGDKAEPMEEDGDKAAEGDEAPAAAEDEAADGEQPAEPWSPEKPPADDAAMDEEMPADYDADGAGGVKRSAPEDFDDGDERPSKVARAVEPSAQPEEGATDGPDVQGLVLAGEGQKLELGDLKAWLEDRGLPITGTKAALIDRVQEAVNSGAG